MKVKTSELSGVALDWAVAKVEGLEIESIHPGYHINVWRIDPLTGEAEFGYPYKPSVNWSQGGSLVEREHISIAAPSLLRDQWRAMISLNTKSDWILGDGPTPLIAAMRGYVSSELGDEVDVPEELLK